MIYSLAGMAVAALVALVAWRCSRSPGGFYDREVYGMTSSTHRRYAILSVAFAVYFGVAYALHRDAAGIAGLGLYAVIAVLYAASFLQGAPDE